MYEVDSIDVVVGDLPDALFAALAELRTALELSPWTVGRPWVVSNATGMRIVAFGEGRALLVFGVLELERVDTPSGSGPPTSTETVPGSGVAQPPVASRCTPSRWR